MGNRPIWLFDPGLGGGVEFGWLAGHGPAQHAIHVRGPGMNWSRIRSTKSCLMAWENFWGWIIWPQRAPPTVGTVMAYLPNAQVIHGGYEQNFRRRWQRHGGSIRGTGEATSAGKFPTSGKKQFSPPGEGDWVLVLDDASRNLPAPGQAKTTMTQVFATGLSAPEGPVALAGWHLAHRGRWRRARMRHSYQRRWSRRKKSSRKPAVPMGWQLIRRESSGSRSPSNLHSLRVDHGRKVGGCCHRM